MYTKHDFRTKKALKDAVARGIKVEVTQPNDMFGVNEAIKVGKHTVYLEGPHYPQPHRWYAEAEIEDGVVVKVK